MGVVKAQVISALAPPLPLEIVTHMIDEYVEMKQHFALNKYRPNELHGGRFAESLARLLQYLHGGSYTPYGSTLPGTEAIFNNIVHVTGLHDSIRLYVPRLARMLLDVRNRRDVAHAGGDVSPNYSDAVFVVHMADWVMTELVRVYYSCNINTAKTIVESLNEAHVPIVEDVNGFVRILNSKLETKDMVLTIIYSKNPDPVKDNDLLKWTRYGNTSRFKTKILADLDKEALIHYDSNGLCTLLRKGLLHVEKYINLDLVVV